MKTLKLLFALLIVTIAFTACSSDDDGGKTTVEVINNLPPQSPSLDYDDGSLYEVLIHEYRGDDPSGEVSAGKINPGGGSTGRVEIDSETEKVRISFRFLPRESSYYSNDINKRRYVASYKYIKAGENNVIELESNTQVGPR